MVTKPSNAIYRDLSYGPIFGSNSNIYIANNVNSNRYPQANFGYADAYSIPRGVQNKQTLLAGSLYFTPDD